MFHILFSILGVILGLSALLAVYMLVTLKVFSQKLAALDVLTTLITGAIVILSVVFESYLLLDIALIYAILSFTVLLLAARYLERGI